MSNVNPNKPSVNQRRSWGILNRFGFGGRFFLYFAVFATILVLCLGGILYLIFTRISTHGSIESRLERIQYETYPAVSDFDRFELSVYSGNVTSLCGYLEFYGDSFVARDGDGNTIEHNSADGYIVDSQSGWTLEVAEAIDTGCSMFSFDANRFVDHILELSLPFGKDSTNIWVDGYYKFKNHQGQEEAFLRCNLKSGTIISFIEPVQLVDKRLGKAVCDGVKEIVLRNDCIVYTGFNAREIPADLQTLTDEARVSLIVGGDHPSFTLQVSNAHGVDVSGSGELNYYMNDSNEYHEIHSQSIKIENGDCDVFYAQADGVESLRIEGVADDLLISGQGRKPRMLSWVWNNIGLLPASLLTIFGGAITFAAKMADKFDMGNETKDKITDCKCQSTGDSKKVENKKKKQRKKRTK